ncbi:MAG TPA: tetratricopeptide repeat protein [Ignavibacteriaceae bacterium]|nr:tetratricopeptide repeat protein [Ignavibacteriaceae bacterium]
MKKAAFLFLFVLFSLSTYAQNASFDSTVMKGIKEIYNIKFNDAEVTFRGLMADYPKHPAGKFFLAMIDWWKILLDLDNESYDDMFYQKLEDVIYQCDEILDKNPNDEDALFFKGGAIGFRGRLRAYRESWIKAADDGREALPIVEKAASLNPNNYDVQLGFGIYNYYASIIPDQYPIIKPLMIFFPKGDKQKGIEQLNLTAQKGKYAKYEARYFLMTLYYHYEGNPYKSDEYAKQLIGDFPDNPTFEKWEGRIAAKKGEYKNASIVFRSVLDKANKNYYGYNNDKTIREATYYIAMQYQYENNLDSAKIFFETCENLSRKIDKNEESGFLINTALYLGMLNDQLGNRDKAKDYYNELLDMREYGRSHTLAKQYLETPYKK